MTQNRRFSVYYKRRHGRRALVKSVIVVHASDYASAERAFRASHWAEMDAGRISIISITAMAQ